MSSTVGRLFSLFPLLLTLCSTQGTSGNCVELPQGQVCGGTKHVLGNNIHYYFGIPYAKPPTGKRRFKPPRRLKQWKETIDATKFGKSCFQDTSPAALHPGLAQYYADPTHMSEDCLFLNIWAQRSAELSEDSYPEEKLPVIVFIHGGSFVSGSSSLDLYNGDVVAAKTGVIFVSLNYRLGMLGFAYLGIPEVPGNMGLLDQQLAMEWVHDNIAAFGGDPSRITLLGQSAGAACVSAHLASPKSLPLFTGAIIQSGTFSAQWALLHNEEALTKAQERAIKLGACEAQSLSQTLNCLRGMTPQALSKRMGLSSGSNFDVGLVNYDVSFFKGNAFDTLASQDYSNHTIVVGATADEAKFFMPLFFPKQFSLVNPDWSLSSEEFTYGVDMELKPVYDDPGHRKKIIATYSSESLGENYADKMAKLYTEHGFICPGLDLLETLLDENSKSGRQGSKRRPKAAYSYIYNHTSSSLLFPDFLGAYHSADIAFTFGKPFRPEETKSWSDNDRVVSEEIMTMLSNVAKFGKPIEDNNAWPKVDTVDNIDIRLIDSSKESLLMRPIEILERCRLFWNFDTYRQIHRDEL